MEKIKINETPKRTSRNFNINNISINKELVKTTLSQFSNVNIKSSCNKIKTNVVLFEKENNHVEEFDTKIIEYGISDDITNLVRTQKNVQIEIKAQNLKTQNVYIDFVFDENNLSLVDFVNIDVDENAKLNLVITYRSKQNVTKTYHNEILKLTAGKNSCVNVCYVNLMEDNGVRLSSVQNSILEGAKVKYTLVELGANTIISNFNSALEGDFSNLDVNTIYLGNKNQVIDLNYIASQYGKNSIYNLDVQGAIKDNAKKHFKGDIDFKKGCKKSKGNENESCIVLSKNAHSISLPMLLCSEEDVEGNHSSSAGKIDEKELFYIMSRGIAYKDALKLVLRARFNKVIDRIKDQNLQDEIIAKIDEKLD